MAATVSVWGTKPGAWALDAEEHEEELQQQRIAMEEAKASAAVPAADFPALSVAVATKGKKKKAQTLTLGEFTGYSAPKANQARGLTTEDLMQLPTGPRERTAEELERSRGGGFRSYGRSEGDGDRWGNRGSDESRRPRGESREPLGPSKADEVDDWAAGKRSVMAGNGGGFDRRERTGAGFFGSDSKADEADSWVSKKSFTPSEPARRFGASGFERERSYEPFSSNGGGADSDSWGRKKEERVVVGGGENGQGSRPKLNLKPRSLPVSYEKPQSPDVAVKPKASNPFGEARPREQVLAEKGHDWKKVDEQFESLKIKERPGSGDRPGSSDRPGSGKRGFGSGAWRGNAGEDKAERSWRKPEPGGSLLTSADKSTEKIEEKGNTEQK